MDKKFRPVPYDTPEDWARGIQFWMRCNRMTRGEARQFMLAQRRAARNIPLPGERCGAWSRSAGRPCIAKAMANGRCKHHGGLSTGPTTQAGKGRNAERLLAWVRDHRKGVTSEE